MNAARRRVVIGFLAASAIGLAWFAPDQDDGLARNPIPPSDVSAAPVSPDGRVAARHRLVPLRAWPSPSGYEPLPEKDPQALPEQTPREVEEASMAAVETALLLRPVTPKIPFRYLGSLVVDGEVSVFLSSGNETLSAKIGAVLPGGWRFDAAAAGRLDFTFLPTESPQSLTIAAP